MKYLAISLLLTCLISFYSLAGRVNIADYTDIGDEPVNLAEILFVIMIIVGAIWLFKYLFENNKNI